MVSKRMKVFSKRHPEAAKKVILSQAVRQRIWYVLRDYDPYYSDNDFNDYTLSGNALPDHLMREHGWQQLRAYQSRDEWEEVTIDGFVLRGVARFVLDALELFHDQLLEYNHGRYRRSQVDVAKYQANLNAIFEEANLPWRMLEGRIIQVDSKWLEEEVLSKAAELLSVSRFEGALAEFLQARSDLSSGDFKGAINNSNLALESTMKVIVGVQEEKPGALLRKLIETRIVPDYHDGFLKAFEEHILRSVPTVRNFEKGVGHGQGKEVNEPPESLAELAVNLTGVLILYLLKRYSDLNPDPREEVGEPAENDIPF